MATLNIKIKNPVRDLIHNLREVSSNSCVSVFEFEILSTPNASIGISLNNNSTRGADNVQLNYNGRWIDITPESSEHIFNLRATGKAYVRVTVGNAVNNVCNIATLTVSDYTNLINSVAASESTTVQRCINEPRCGESSVEPSLTQNIDATTNLIIYVDGSGSMSATISSLNTLKNGLLKTTLLPYYNNDENLYNSKVEIREVSSLSSPLYERGFGMLAYENQVLDGKVIAMVFQDEGDTYTGPGAFSAYNPRTPDYDTDIKALRQRLLSFPENYYHGIMFQINHDSLDGNNFKVLLQACHVGAANYSGVNGLSDKKNIGFKYDLIEGETPQYYLDHIISALNNLGFDL